MSNYPPGAANDPRAPYNEPLTKKALVEVNVELGTIVEIEIEVDEDGYPEAEDLRNLVAEELRIKYGVDDKDTILTDIKIWDWRLK